MDLTSFQDVLLSCGQKTFRCLRWKGKWSIWSMVYRIHSFFWWWIFYRVYQSMIRKINEFFLNEFVWCVCMCMLTPTDMMCVATHRIIIFSSCHIYQYSGYEILICDFFFPFLSCSLFTHSKKKKIAATRKKKCTAFKREIRQDISLWVRPHPRSDRDRTDRTRGKRFYPLSCRSDPVRNEWKTNRVCREAIRPSSQSHQTDTYRIERDKINKEIVRRFVQYVHQRKNDSRIAIRSRRELERTTSEPRF